jgi:MraZ protein
VFYSTFEKPLDAKRRIVVPQEFRAFATGPFDGIFCFPSVEADCIEAGGKALFERNEALINEFEVGDPLRYSPAAPKSAGPSSGSAHERGPTPFRHAR